MKTPFIILLCSCFCITANAQRGHEMIYWPFDNANKIQFSETVPLAAGAAANFFSNGKSFATSTFGTERDTILANEVNNTFVCQGSLSVDVPELADRGKGYLSFKLTLEGRRNSFKYTITDLYHHAISAEGASGGPLERLRPLNGGIAFPIQYWNKVKAESYYKLQNLIEKMKESFSRE